MHPCMKKMFQDERATRRHSKALVEYRLARGGVWARVYWQGQAGLWRQLPHLWQVAHALGAVGKLEGRQRLCRTQNKPTGARRSAARPPCTGRQWGLSRASTDRPAAMVVHCPPVLRALAVLSCAQPGHLIASWTNCKALHSLPPSPALGAPANASTAGDTMAMKVVLQLPPRLSSRMRVSLESLRGRARGMRAQASRSRRGAPLGYGKASPEAGQAGEAAGNKGMATFDCSTSGHRTWSAARGRPTATACCSLQQLRGASHAPLPAQAHR